MKSVMLTCRDVSLARKARYIYSFYEAIMFIIDAPVDIRYTVNHEYWLIF